MSLFIKLIDSIFRIRRQQPNQQQRNDRYEDNRNAVCIDQTETLTQETVTEEAGQVKKPLLTLKRNDKVDKKFPIEQRTVQPKDPPKKEKSTPPQVPSKKLLQKPLAENEQTEFEKVNAKMRPAISRKSSRSEDRKREKKDIQRLMTSPQWRNQKKKRRKNTCIGKETITEEDGATKTPTTVTTTTTDTTITEGNDTNKGKEGGGTDEDREGSTENDDYGTKTACNVPFVNMQFQ